MPLLSHGRVLLSVVALAPVLACGGGQGNQPGGSAGGNVSAGGSPEVGGGSGSGGSPGSGGRAEAGGANATRQAGGSNGPGGSFNAGGAVPNGGANGTGGAPAAGGAGATSTGANACSSGPLATSIAKCVIVAPPSTGDYHQDCVDTINKIRLDCMCLPPLARWPEGEACADQMAEYDSGQDSAHAGFIARLCTPGGTAQCECPGWSSVTSITQGTSRMESCLSMMWHEVDNPSGEQGHYQAMSSKTYTKVACGINASATNVWAVQNYSR